MTVAVDRSNYPSALDAGIPAINYRNARHPDEAHHTIRQAREQAPIALGPHAHELLTYELVRAVLRDPRLRITHATYRRAVQPAEKMADRRRRIYALGYLALIAAEHVQPAATEHQIRRAAYVGTDLGYSEHFVKAMVSLAAATVRDMGGESATAADAAHLAVVLTSKGAGNLEVAKALLLRAKILEELGDHETAEASRREVCRLLRGCPDGIAKTLLAGVGQSAHDTTIRGIEGRAVNEELTSKELGILRLLATQLSRREIGQRLYVSLNTVKTHQRAVYRKLGVDNRSAAVRRALELGLL
jgi:LuxR family transcriptional regulator, maltose regulon positive regulatory protein